MICGLPAILGINNRFLLRNDMTNHTPAEALRLKQIDAHTLAVIWLSVTARALDLLGRPDLALQASIDAGANARCVLALAGTTGSVSR